MNQNKKRGLCFIIKRLPLGNRLVQPRISDPVGEHNARNIWYNEIPQKLYAVFSSGTKGYDNRHRPRVISVGGVCEIIRV